MEQYEMILNLQRLGFSVKGIARQMGLARNTVRKYLAQGHDDGQQLDSDIPSALPPSGLTQRLQHLQEHFAYAELELKKTGVTRQMLWLEYKDLHPDGVQYSQYCHHFKQHLRYKEVVMHLEYKPGEVAMMDFAGKKLSYVDPQTAEVIDCQVFVAILPFSGLTFAQAVHTQRTGDVVSCINDMCHYFGGLSVSFLCDNLKTLVVRPDRYEPLFTEVCDQLSAHYGVCFTATRPYKPRDKAMVEGAVKIVYTSVYAVLRNKTFHSLKELNHHIAQCMDALNLRPYKGSGYSRRDLFAAREQPVLQPLPVRPFIHKKCILATVQRNYHILLGEDKHYYSVHFTHTGKKVRVLYDSDSVEIYLDGQRIACHQRERTASKYHTLPDHLPQAHAQALACRGWTEDELLAAALRVGPRTHEAARRILSSNIYAVQNYKSCNGMILLHKKYGIQRLEAACERVCGASRVTYTMIRNILERGMDRLPQKPSGPSLPDHHNIRGPGHYS